MLDTIVAIIEFFFDLFSAIAAFTGGDFNGEEILDILDLVRAQNN